MGWDDLLWSLSWGSDWLSLRLDLLWWSTLVVRSSWLLWGTLIILLVSTMIVSLWGSISSSSSVVVSVHVSSSSISSSTTSCSLGVSTESSSVHVLSITSLTETLHHVHHTSHKHLHLFLLHGMLNIIMLLLSQILWLEIVYCEIGSKWITKSSFINGFASRIRLRKTDISKSSVLSHVR